MILTFVDHMNIKTGFDYSQQFQNVIPSSGLVFGFKAADANNKTVEYLFSILSLLGGAYQQQNLWKKRCQWLVGFKRRCLFLPHLAQLAPIIKFQVVHAHHYCKGWNYYTVWPGPIWTKLKTSWQITFKNLIF